MAPALAQDYGAGWFDVSRGIGQAFGQQEALRDRMRVTREADPAEAATAPVADEQNPGDSDAEKTIFQQVADALRHAAGTSQARTTPPEITAIARFKASPAVRERVARRFVTLLEQNNVDESGQIRALLASGSLSRDFDAVLDQFGFDKANLAHVITAYYIGMWEVANGQSLTAEQARAVCDGLAPVLVRETDIGALSEAQKQEVAESYTLLVMLAVLNQQVLGPQDMSAFRQSVYRDVLRQGVNLYRLSVDEHGFSLH